MIKPIIQHINFKHFPLMYDFHLYPCSINLLNLDNLLKYFWVLAHSYYVDVSDMDS